MEYRLLQINYMSGTGNSFRAAVWMKEAAQKKGIDTEMEQIAVEKTVLCKKPGTLTGFVFPTHGFTAPWSVIKHALQLPFGNGQHVFVVATKGALMVDSAPFHGFEGSAAYLIVLILLLKGYRILGVMGLDMPANMINVHSGLTEADSRIIINQAKEKVDFFINRILGGEKEFWGIKDLFLGLALLPLSAIYMGFVRFFLAKLFFTSENCTGCGRCSKSCPKNAIIMVGRKRPRPYWKLTCESCMRCMNYCPEKAIEASHLFAAFLCLLITIPTPHCVLNLMNEMNLDMGNPFLISIINYIEYLVKISLSYSLFSCIIRIPQVNKVITYATLTHYYRRYHEPDTELKDMLK